MPFSFSLLVFVAQRQAEFIEFFDNLVKRFASQVPDFQHFVFRLSDQVFDGEDTGALEAVERTDAEVQFFDAHIEGLLLFVVVFADQNIHVLHIVYEIDEEFHVIAHDLRGEADDLSGRAGRVGLDVDGELVVVDGLFDTGHFYVVADGQNGREQRVDGDVSERLLLSGLVSRARNVSSTHADIELHVESITFFQGADIRIRIHDLDLAGQLDIFRGDYAAFFFMQSDFLLGKEVFRKDFYRDLFQIKYDFRYVFFHAGDGTELMPNTLDLDADDRRARKSRAQDSAQSVSDSCAVSTFERFYNKARLRFVGTCDFRQFRFSDFHHRD